MKKKPAHNLKMTLEMMHKICDRLSQGESLLQICKDKAYPNYSNVTRAVQRDQELWELYRKGRALQAEFLADKINDLATSELPTVDKNGQPFDSRYVNAEVQRRRLEIDTLKWTLGRIAPYGIRDKKEDQVQNNAITITWQADEVPGEEVTLVSENTLTH